METQHKPAERKFASFCEKLDVAMMVLDWRGSRFIYVKEHVSNILLPKDQFGLPDKDSRGTSARDTA